MLSKTNHSLQLRRKHSGCFQPKLIITSHRDCFSFFDPNCHSRNTWNNAPALAEKLQALPPLELAAEKGCRTLWRPLQKFLWPNRGACGSSAFPSTKHYYLQPPILPLCWGECPTRPDRRAYTSLSGCSAAALVSAHLYWQFTGGFDLRDKAPAGSIHDQPDCRMAASSRASTETWRQQHPQLQQEASAELPLKALGTEVCGASALLKPLEQPK